MPKLSADEHVLMVAYYYPPLGGIGSQRSQKFARYLSGFGWTPIVLTPERGAYYVDRSLDDGASKGVTIVRTPAFDPSSAFKRLVGSRSSGVGQPFPAVAELRPLEGGRIVNRLRDFVRTWVYVPDGQVGWLPYAVRAGARALESRNVKVLYSSSFPVTSHLVAYWLKRRTGTPWVADFRDLWTENHYARATSPLRRKLDRAMEAKLLAAADALVTVSDTWAEALRRLSGGRKRVVVIRNGFDPVEIAPITVSKADRWTVTHVGTFYGSRQDPSPFLKVLARLIGDGRIARDQVRFNVVGGEDPFVRERVREFQLEDVTTWVGVVPHGESLSHQVNSSLLLLIIREEAANAGLIPGKLYEYLGARRPILGIVPRHFEAAEIIRRAGAGIVCDATDEVALERCLLDSYSAFRSGMPSMKLDGDLSPYERRAQAGQLAALLSDVTGPRASAPLGGWPAGHR